MMSLCDSMVSANPSHSKGREELQSCGVMSSGEGKRRLGSKDD